MKFMGINCRKQKNLTWRRARPSDPDNKGEPRGDDYGVSIVRTKDCSVAERDGRRFWSVPDDAPAIPMSAAGSSYGYGQTKKMTARAGGKAIGHEGKWVIVGEYFATPVYVVRDGQVYRGYIHQARPNLAYFIEQGYSLEEASKMRDEYEVEVFMEYDEERDCWVRTEKFDKKLSKLEEKDEVRN